MMLSVFQKEKRLTKKSKGKKFSNIRQDFILQNQIIQIQTIFFSSIQAP